MTTTTARPRPATAAALARAPRPRAGTARRPARVAALALGASTALLLPATALLDSADRPAVRAAAGVVFVLVAGLEVVVGWGLYALLNERAHSPAYAALVSRAGYAVLLTAAAGRLLWPGGDGVAGFRQDWSLALVVLGVHLLVTSVALWHSRRVPLTVVAGTAAAGTASVLGQAVASWPLPDVLPGAGMLVPGALGGLVLLAWLGTAGREPENA